MLKKLFEKLKTEQEVIFRNCDTDFAALELLEKRKINIDETHKWVSIFLDSVLGSSAVFLFITAMAASNHIESVWFTVTGIIGSVLVLSYFVLYIFMYKFQWNTFKFSRQYELEYINTVLKENKKEYVYQDIIKINENRVFYKNDDGEIECTIDNQNIDLKLIEVHQQKYFKLFLDYCDARQILYVEEQYETSCVEKIPLIEEPLEELKETDHDKKEVKKKKTTAKKTGTKKASTKKTKKDDVLENETNDDVLIGDVIVVAKEDKKTKTDAKKVKEDKKPKKAATKKPTTKKKTVKDDTDSKKEIKTSKK